jgi:Uma2 family endonuclease
MAALGEHIGRAPRILSEAEYYALDEKSDRRLEFIGGEIRAIAGASIRHVNIANRISVALATRLGDGPCEVVSSDLRVKVEATDEKFYPDVVVYCDEPRVDPNQANTLLSPTVLIEILSPSTYRQIPTLQHYLIVDQRQVLVHHHRRLGENEWRLDLFHWRREEIVLDDLGVRFPLEEIYRRLEVPEGLVLVSEGENSEDTRRE